MTVPLFRQSAVLTSMTASQLPRRGLPRDEYFGWDPSRFPSRRAHNAVRARGQLALGLAVRAARAEALAVVQ